MPFFIHIDVELLYEDNCWLFLLASLRPVGSRLWPIFSKFLSHPFYFPHEQFWGICTLWLQENIFTAEMLHPHVASCMLLNLVTLSGFSSDSSCVRYCTSLCKTFMKWACYIFVFLMSGWFLIQDTTLGPFESFWICES